MPVSADVGDNLFQSTPLMRGATHFEVAKVTSEQFQSTPLMRGATVLPAYVRFPASISIHAPHARSDGDLNEPVWLAYIFQSTLLMRGAT